MLVWLDMANSPHPMLLGPVAEELERAGHEVWVTTRDHAQTVDLTRAQWPEATIIGGASPSSRSGKVRVLAQRVKSLRRLAVRRAPDVALSMNSYAQVIAARTAGIPSVTLMDYEFQPANHVSFRLAQTIVAPMSFPQERLRHYGVRSTARLRQFDGYKEEFYLDRDADTVNDGWGAGDGDRVRCLFRPPPSGAMYHRAGNSLFDELLVRAGRRGDAEVLVLPRFPEQRAAYAAIPGILVAERTMDGLQALRSADVFVGAGGTMCREAALLGVPAYTVFAGRMAAVDERLIAEQRLHDLRDADIDVDAWARRDPDDASRAAEELHRRAEDLRRWLVSVTEATAERSAHRSQPPQRETRTWASPR